jgi:sulfite reductase (NADPH) hemoprotein beta-component
VIGPAFAAQQIPYVIQRLLEVYLALRQEGEIFIDAVERLGLEPFKTRVYGGGA